MVAEPLTDEAFQPFGYMLAASAGVGRRYFDAGLGDTRESAWPSLSIAHNIPVPLPSIRITRLERHPFSSQSFIPLDGGRYLIVVCPETAGASPAVSDVRAFVAQPWQGITYRRNVWHHPLTVLDRPARHAIFMWKDGSEADEQFADVGPFNVLVPT